MNKFFDKLICGFLSLLITSASTKINANVLSSSVKLIANAFGLILSMYIRNDQMYMGMLTATV